jgi:hypothetical protein
VCQLLIPRFTKIMCPCLVTLKVRSTQTGLLSQGNTKSNRKRIKQQQLKALQEVKAHLQVLALESGGLPSDDCPDVETDESDSDRLSEEWS